MKSMDLPEVVSIDIGCGTSKHPEARFGIDMRPLPGVDFICDLEQERLPFDDDSVDKSYCYHTLEHIENLEHILREVIRVSKNKAVFEVVVPHFSNTLAYSDYTHRRFFGYYTFNYFSAVEDRWKVPRYSDEIRFDIVSRELCFKNFSVLGRFVGWVFNSSSFMAYLYESKFSWILPCFEIKFLLRIRKTAT